ncbi:O-antigen ligase family protein [Achromobacter kerstersii]|uniref:O-antigen ligase family protein n=1 Tax=Achromobacter kerstersii TaxID=1353890 RepID=UPI00313CFE4F
MLPLLPQLIVTLLTVLPVAAMTLGGASTLFYAIVLACLIRCVHRPGGWRETLHDLTPYRYVIGALTVPICAIVLSQLAHGSFHSASIERGLRISLAFPIILGAMLSIDAKLLRYAAGGISVAALASAAIVFWLVFPRWNRPDTPQYNAVGYGNLLLLWLVFIVYAWNWALTKRPQLEKCVTGLIIVSAFAGFVLTQTRTGWLAIPLFVLIALWLFGKPRQPLKAIGLLAGSLAILVALGSSNQALRARVAQGIQEVQECHGSQATADTSMCIRLQLWRASLQMIEAEPVFGLGSPERFVPELEARVATGVVSPFVAQDFGEPHNDILQIQTTYGLLGSLGLMLLYAAPAYVYFRRLAAQSPMPIRIAAAMGLALTLGFAIFGLTELMFRSMQNISLYVTLVAWLLALSDKNSDVRAGNWRLGTPP